MRDDMAMRRSFPDENEAPAMPVEALAMGILDELVSPSTGERSSLAGPAFIRHYVSNAYGRARRRLTPGPFAFDSDDAIRAFPEYAKALTEAWALLEARGLLVPDPAIPARRIVSRSGEQRLVASTMNARVATTRGAGSDDPPPAIQRNPEQGDDDGRAPTAVVLWAHSGKRWGEEERRHWKGQIYAFVNLLRECGVDADFDLFHGSAPTDWARFGPTAIRQSDYILVAVSDTWRQAWDGQLTAGESAGAVGEADVLLGLYNNSPDDFRRRVVVTVLPGRTTEDIPLQLRSTLPWVRVDELSEMGLQDLLRRLTDQPEYIKVPLGRRRHLPPVTVDGRRSDLVRPDWYAGEPDQPVSGRSGQTAADALASLPRTTQNEDGPTRRVRERFLKEVSHTESNAAPTDSHLVDGLNDRQRDLVSAVVRAWLAREPGPPFQVFEVGSLPVDHPNWPADVPKPSERGEFRSLFADGWIDIDHSDGPAWVFSPSVKAVDAFRGSEDARKLAELLADPDQRRATILAAVMIAYRSDPGSPIVLAVSPKGEAVRHSGWPLPIGAARSQDFNGLERRGEIALECRPDGSWSIVPI